MDGSNFSNLLKSAVDINKESNIEEIPSNNDVTTITEEMNNSRYIYPTIILIPICIVAITLLTLDISWVTKIILLLMLAVSIIFYVMQIKDIKLAIDQITIFSKKNKYKGHFQFKN